MGKNWSLAKILNFYQISLSRKFIIKNSVFIQITKVLYENVRNYKGYMKKYNFVKKIFERRINGS